MDDKTPQKHSKKKKKPSTSKVNRPTPTPLPETATNSEILSKEENELFLQQIGKFLKQKDIQKKEKADDFKILHNNISEYLESFIAFGYTFDGQRVLIQQYPSPRDKDAILEFLKNVFIMNTSTDDNLRFNADDE